MATKIKPLRKFTTGAPSTSDMEVGEIAVNTADKKIYMRDNTSGASSIVEVANASGGSAADDITLGNAAVTIATSSGSITIDNQANNQDIIFKGNDAGSTITALTLDMSAGGNAKFRKNINLESDGSLLRFGADKDVEITHVHNTGLLLNSTSQLQFFDANESVNSDGTNLILTSGGTSFKIPTSDGGTGTFLKTDGAGNLSFAAASGGVTSDSQNNTSGGSNALDSMTSGQANNNTAFGKDALTNITTGDGNSGFGSKVLDAATIGNDNNAFGHNALTALTEGSSNNAFGSTALDSITTGSSNSAFGSGAANGLTIGDNNIAVGHLTMERHSESDDNVAIGYMSMYGTFVAGGVISNKNVAIGRESLYNMSSGANQNVGIGYRSSYNLSTGDSNITIGHESALGLTTGGQNVFIGPGAAKGDGSNAVTGSSNVAIGESALEKLQGSSSLVAIGRLAMQNTHSADNSVAVGTMALQAGTDYSYAVAVGTQAFYTLTTGSYNTGVGHFVGGNITDGTRNSLFGYEAGYNIQGNNNTAIGNQALYYSTSDKTGANNTGLGYRAGFVIEGGDQNTFVGYQSGQAMTTGNNNVFLGGYDGNSGGVDLRTSSNNVVLSDGAGNIRGRFDSNSNLFLGGDLTLTSTDAGSTDNPTISLKRDSSSPNFFDDIGEIEWLGENSASEEIRYGHIKTQITNPTDGAEESRMVFSIFNDGADKEMMFLDAQQGGGVMYLTSGIDILFEGDSTNTAETTLTVTNPTIDRTITLPDASGTVHTTANPEINGAYGSSSAPRILKVTVATQTTAHPYNGDGSSSKYVIDGVMGAALTLHGADNNTSNSQYYYRFDQSDNSNTGHPLRFYLQADKTTAYTTGVTTNGTPGQSGAYTQIAVTQDTPQILYYQCSQHGYMGNYVIVPHSTNIKQNNGNISLNAVGGQIQLNGDTGNSVKVTGDLETTGSIQLGNQSDTTLSRSAAGTAQIEGNTILTLGNSDAPTTTTSSSGVNVLVDDGGTMKKITPANLGVGSGGGGGSTAADDITEGNAAVNLTTTSGNITIDAQGSDTDIIFKGTDGSTDVTFLTFDGSADTATFETSRINLQLTTGALTGQFTGSGSSFFKTVRLTKPAGYGDVDLIFDNGTYTTTLENTDPASQNQTITLPDATGTVLTTGNSDTPTTITSSSGVLVLVDDSGTMKKITPANLGIGGGGGGSNQNAFSKFSVAGQTSVEADAVEDEVTLVGAGGINITTNASNDTITFTGGGAGISEEQAIAFAIVYG